jgi:hypothetical protein
VNDEDCRSVLDEFDTGTVVPDSTQVPWKDLQRVLKYCLIVELVSTVRPCNVAPVWC